MHQLKTQLREITKHLRASSETAQLDAELILMHVLNKPRAFLYAHSDALITDEEQKKLAYFVEKRALGVPMAYLLGRREFWSLNLSVTPDTLIPRPETELLVEEALASSQKKLKILELGTGTGAITIALATERPDWQFTATDISEKALVVAKANCARYQLKNIILKHSNWFDNINTTDFDMIISNPPYLALDDIHQHQGDLRFEPKNALLSGPEGLDALQHIIENGMNYLKPGGLLLLEHGYNQADALAELLQTAGYQNIATCLDSNQIARVTKAFKPE